jgi:hypothetical protein
MLLREGKVQKIERKNQKNEEIKRKYGGGAAHKAGRQSFCTADHITPTIKEQCL